MANEQLETFLARGRETVSDDAGPPPPQEAPAPPPEAVEKPAAAVAARPDDDDPDPPEPAEGEPVVPRKALDAARHQRRDWKARAIEHETRAETLQRQLDEIKNAPPPQPQQSAQPRHIDPATDPVAYDQMQQGRMLNHALNVSEAMTRDRLGADVVDAAVMDFKQAAAQDPTLFGKLYSQVHPYAWLVQEVEKIRLRREIGDDPAGFEARLRAKWEAEAGNGNGSAPRVSPAAGLPPSLAQARSSMPRSAPAWTGPKSITDILAGRKL